MYVRMDVCIDTIIVGERERERERGDIVREMHTYCTNTTHNLICAILHNVKIIIAHKVYINMYI